jgi:hypothetical protein
MSDVSVRTLILEFVDSNGANHIREMHIEILRHKPGAPEHTIRARLSESVADGLLSRLGDGFCVSAHTINPHPDPRQLGSGLGERWSGNLELLEADFPQMSRKASRTR